MSDFWGAYHYSSGSFVLLWDGLEADTSNGVIAYLTFTAPKTEGSYDITVAFDDGDIVDGDLNPVKVGLVQGKAIITSKQSVNIKVNNVDYTLISKENTPGIILVFFYDASGKQKYYNTDKAEEGSDRRAMGLFTNNGKTEISILTGCVRY